MIFQDFETEMKSKEPLHDEVVKTSQHLLKTARSESIIGDVPETERKIEKDLERWKRLKNGTLKREEESKKFTAMFDKFHELSESLHHGIHAQIEQSLKESPQLAVSEKKTEKEVQRLEVRICEIREWAIEVELLVN